MRLKHGKNGKLSGKFYIEYDCYTVVAQTYMDYNGCLPKYDDMLDHIRIPRLVSVHTSWHM